nr:MAG TPA: hypothetical protein [Caudoviricetes sp.]
MLTACSWSMFQLKSGNSAVSRGGELRKQRTSEVRHKELDCVKAL